MCLEGPTEDRGSQYHVSCPPYGGSRILEPCSSRVLLGSSDPKPCVSKAALQRIVDPRTLLRDGPTVDRGSYNYVSIGPYGGSRIRQPCFPTALQRIADLRIINTTRVFVCWPTPPRGIYNLSSGADKGITVSMAQCAGRPHHQVFST